MSVWFCIPSKRPTAEANVALSKWQARGYKIALWIDEEDLQRGLRPIADMYLTGPYPGYARAVNALIFQVLQDDTDCQWVVTGGDDTWPDPNHTADEIAAQCSAHFGEAAIVSGFTIGAIACGKEAMAQWDKASTFGVMQPTGDAWSDHMGRIIERIAGSPWIGRSFCERINGGKGPYWPEYRHNWLDEEIMLVAQKLGVFWQRRDLIHYHDHCMRVPGGKWAPHLQWVSADYAKMKPLFDQRKAAGFPGSEPL